MGLGHALAKAPTQTAGFIEGLRASVPALRAGAMIGGGVALGDKLLTHHLKKKAIKAAKEKQQGLLKKASGLGTFTPARALHTGNEVAHFEKKVHMGVEPRTAGLLGEAGRLPKV
jgi:hypothetical protein